jgi:hypothetical protein
MDVSWQSVSNKTYTLLRSSDLTQTFTPIQTGIAATAPTNTFYDSTATGNLNFYRAMLESPFPTKTLPPFHVLDVRPDPLGGLDLRWESSANNTYSIYRSTNLAQGFINVQSYVPATPGTNTFRDTTANGSGPYLYRVKAD